MKHLPRKNRLSAVAALGLLLPGVALGHDAQTFGSVAVVMSTSANDKLRVNADTRVYFDLQKSGQPLPVTTCKCTLLVYAGPASARVKPLAVLKLAALPGGQDGALVTITQAGDYTLVLDGRPLKFGDFDPFKAQYTLTAAENVVGEGR